jgi:hypothetical protein
MNQLTPVVAIDDVHRWWPSVLCLGRHGVCRAGVAGDRVSHTRPKTSRTPQGSRAWQLTRSSTLGESHGGVVVAEFFD